MNPTAFTNGKIIRVDRILEGGALVIQGDRIDQVLTEKDNLPPEISRVDLNGGYLAPGFVDLHVHGGEGADFMDGTEEAFRTVCRAHARHGTTSLLPTTTVARHDQHLQFLQVCQKLQAQGTGSARILGAHFYGPYFALDARGCHPGEPVRSPKPEEYQNYLDFADSICRATVAPELEGAEEFVRDCRERNIGCNVGHSYATFAQMQEALRWGVTHVDHLFCAMSDRARLRQTQTYPMRGGVMEATLYFEELTTEVIADGKHLEKELLLLALKIKGPERLALVTDCNRAMDKPDGDYVFGPQEGGEPILKKDGVGLMPDGNSLASSVVGMDHCLRTFYQTTQLPLVDVIQMASLTPARIAGWEEAIGSLEPGKYADLLVLDKDLQVQKVFIGGQLVWESSANDEGE